MSRAIALIILVFLFISIATVPAQEVKKKKPVKATAPADPAPEAKVDSVHIRVFLFPEFYHYWPIDKNDTILKYECYDGYNSLINVDTLHNINDVQHINFVRSFTNYMHTYIDAEGKPRPSTVSKTLYRYDKTDSGTWKSFDVLNNYSAELREYKRDIIRTDTTVIYDPVNREEQTTIRKYYRVTEIEK